jgi:RES domain-containing protein
VNLSPADAANNLVSVWADIPNSVRVERIERSSLPVEWESRPGPDELQEIGDRWLASGTSLVLIVPSVLIPQETNLLVNSEHADFGLLEFGSPEPFRFDPGMWKH